METVKDDQGNNKSKAVGRNDCLQQQLFTGDLDSSALAAEQAELERLVASMEESLEDNEVDMRFEQDEFSVAAKITTETFVADLTSIESIAVKVFNEDTAKMLINQEENFRNQIMPTDEPVGIDDAKEQEARASIPDDNHSASEDGGDDAGNDDLSIDDSVTSQKSASSSTSSSSESSTDDESRADDDDNDDDDHDRNSLHQGSLGGPSRSGSSCHSSRSSLHGSATSLSIFEIHNSHEEYAENENVWIQHGILRVDESSEEQALICDWDRFRKWKKRKLDSSTRQNTVSRLESSSQRWADRSTQDSGLKMPRRRTSDSTHGTRNTENNDNNFADDDDDIPADSVSFFDWKAWRRRKDGHLSSTSRTNPFSVSLSVGDHDDEFDAKSVLAKLDQWEVMMENKSVSLGIDANNSPGSTPADAIATGGGALNRANSEVFASKRASLPVRSNSDQSIHVDEEKVGNDGGHGDRQWKDWRREQRKMRLGGSWSNLSAQLSPGSGAGGTNEDVGAGSENGSDLPCQSPVNRTQSEKAPAANHSPKEQLTRSNSFVLKRTFHQSPLRSPRQKAAVQQSPIGAEWRKWQREKRRTGIWKRTFSDRDNWGLPFHDDKMESPENSSHTDDNGTSAGSSKREQLTKTQSEKWDANSAVSDSKGGNRREQLQRAHSMPLSKEYARNGGFDWKLWRKEQKRPGLDRSQSDRWSSSTAEASTKSDKPPAPPSATHGMRRSHSEKWNNRSSNNMPEAAPRSGNQPHDSTATGTFDWKSWKKTSGNLEEGKYRN